MTINYSQLLGIQGQGPSPGQAIIQGVQQGMQASAMQAQQQNQAAHLEMQRQQIDLQNRKLAEEQRQYEIKRERQLQFFAQAGKIVDANGKVDYEAYKRLIADNPDQIKGIKGMLDAISEPDKKAMLQASYDLTVPILANQKDKVIELATQTAEFFKKQGREDLAGSFSALADLAKSDLDKSGNAIRTSYISILAALDEKAPERLKQAGEASEKLGSVESVVAKKAEELNLTKAQTDQMKALAGKQRAETLKTLFELKALQDPATGAFKSPKEAATAIAKFSDQFNQRIGTAVSTQDAWRRIQAAQANAAGDLSLIFSYMKMLDPGSTVREGEFANAQNATGVPEMVKNWWNRMLSGERLGKDQRAQFLSQAKSLYVAASKKVGEEKAYFTKIAKHFKVDPELIVGGKNFGDSGQAQPSQGKTDFNALFGKGAQQSPPPATDNLGRARVPKLSDIDKALENL